MARDHARMQVAMWDDDDWIGLDFRSQWLYQALVQSKQLSYCGVVSWVPQRFQRLTKGLTLAAIKRAVSELDGAGFVVLDRENAELLVRSYVRHDHVMTRTNMGKAVAKALDKVYSERLVVTVLGELRRVYEVAPDLQGWSGFREIRPDLFDRITSAESPLQLVIAMPDSNGSLQSTIAIGDSNGEQQSATHGWGLQ